MTDIYMGVDLPGNRVACIALYPVAIADHLEIVAGRFGAEQGVIEIDGSDHSEAALILLNCRDNQKRPVGLGWTFVPGDEV